MIWVYIILCIVCPILCPLWIFLIICEMIGGDRK